MQCINDLIESNKVPCLTVVTSIDGLEVVVRPQNAAAGHGKDRLANRGNARHCRGTEGSSRGRRRRCTPVEKGCLLPCAGSCGMAKKLRRRLHLERLLPCISIQIVRLPVHPTQEW